ncbi:hypothetical protein FQN60_001598 [Etheostoma spectabile]|uniref:Uncharacterized protein n=1 Tax=Etheostoma spectabile TaxID=54343 RepID=A0A5J5D4T5_9PERO|nr:hypothetical protein FQN60_001598 [Etheostoma spectabile]
MVSRREDEDLWLCLKMDFYNVSDMILSENTLLFLSFVSVLSLFLYLIMVMSWWGNSLNEIWTRWVEKRSQNHATASVLQPR